MAMPYRLTYASPDDPLLKKVVINAVELATGRRRLERYYHEIQHLAPEQLWGAVLEKLEVQLDFDQAKLALTPGEGPVVFVANHPFGVLDGLILGYLVSLVRPNFFFIVNEVLTRDNPLEKFMLPIDFRETAAAARTNILTRQLAAERLKAGEALAIFPSGGVATSPKFWKPAQDLEWKRFVAKLIQLTKATVVPLYFHGRNSQLFQIASHINQSLRLSLLLNEIRNKIGTTIDINIGSPIPYHTLAGKGRQELLDYLKDVTMALAHGRSASEF